MKNKKGFVFVETIVVCAVLATSLVTIYAAFTMLLRDQKKRNHYDKAVYNYRLYNVAKELNDPLGENCGTYKKVDSSFNLGGIYYYVKAENLKGAGMPTEHNFPEYIKTISTSRTDDCVLIGQFSAINSATNKTEYYYSHVVIERYEGS